MSNDPHFMLRLAAALPTHSHFGFTFKRNALVTTASFWRLLTSYGWTQRWTGAVILPPSGPGSLGDEAMLTPLVHHLSARGCERIAIFSYPSSPESWDIPKPLHYLPLPTGGASDWLRLITELNSFNQLLVLGADVLDGYYSMNTSLLRLRVAEVASALGLKVAILGTSFRPEPHPTVIAAMKNLPPDVRIFARDPISHARLEAMISRPVDLSADLAFLLRPCLRSEGVVRASNWISSQRASGRFLVGVNLNRLVLPEHIRDLTDRLVSLFSQLLQRLYAWNSTLSFVLVPHDYRGSESDVVMAQRMRASLPHELREHTLALQQTYSASEIKGIVSNLDAVLSSRMHLAIACLSSSVPVACIPYQGKFEGLYAHFGLPPLVPGGQDTLDLAALFQLMREVIEKRAHLSKQIASHLPRVAELARKNLPPFDDTYRAYNS